MSDIQFKDMDNEALASTYAEKKAAFTDLVTTLKGQENPDKDKVAEASALAADLDAIEGVQAERAAEQQEMASTIESLASRSFADEGGEEDEVEEEEPEVEETEDESTDADAVAEADAAEATAEVAAAAKPVKAAAKRSVADIARKTKRPETPVSSKPRLSIVASAGVPNYEAGQNLNGIAELGAAVVERMRGFTPPSGDGTREDLQKFTVAKIRTDFPEDLQINRGTDEMEVINRAGDETRLKSAQGQGSLVAAGGWCAPSETLYDLASDESLDGILSLPEVQVNRGGIRFTEGPQFADFYTQAGFIQTEAQAIAGTTKPCYEVDCPAFTEVRLDAVGICIKVPILTNAAWPELVNRFTSGSLIAHQHMVNANVIGRMVALSGALRTFTGLGAVSTDTLEALELVILQRRQSQRLSFGRTLEVVVPVWVRGAIRADLSRRTGQFNPVTDQQINAHFAAIGASVSFVYDWQDLDLVDDEVPIGDNINEYPASFKALVYPAGTFVKGTSAVINLSAVYDAASLAVNTYTGLFMEEGLLVAKRQYGSDYVEIPICNAGRTGAANLTCA